MKTGVELIAIEREEQIKKHGFTKQHDADTHYEGNIVEVVKVVLANKEAKDFPLGWERFSGKMSKKTYKEKLIIAGALLAAEIDRLQSFGNSN